jgi:DNA repair protein RecN (Recombination protein N)
MLCCAQIDARCLILVHRSFNDKGLQGMLVELRAENYAVIDHAIATFGSGLNLLTGETGAGKSILVDALALLMGGKASAEVVRHGAEKAVVSCVFESTAVAETILEENGIDSEGAEIILRREILSTGKGRVFVNNQPATVAVLRQLAPELALVHAQSETLSSFDQAQQRILLDRFGNIATESVAESYSRWREAQARLDDLLQGEQDRLRMVDLWSYQRKEIESGRLEAGEDEKLETEKRVLANAEKLYAAAMGAYDQLYEGNASAEGALRAAIRNVEELARFDARFTELAQQLTSARATIGDAGSTLRDYAEGINASPERLAEIEDRLAQLDRLKRKYGHSVAEVIAFGEDVARKLTEAASAYKKAAAVLTAGRKTAATKLAKLAESEINSLAMKVRFEISVQPAAENEHAKSASSSPGVHAKGQDPHMKGADQGTKGADQGTKGTEPGMKGTGFSPYIDPPSSKGASAPEGNSPDPSHWTAHGWDTVEYRIATNSGEPLKPLHEIASGGEMSRVMLALKVAVEESASKARKINPTPRTLVFDEIDIGIGGRAAEAVGQKLKALARGQQVLCVTHLPQIAAFAGQHLVVEKKEDHGRTKTQIRVLDDRARMHEVARMLSGAKVTDTSLQHAAQMIASSR